MLMSGHRLSSLIALVTVNGNPKRMIKLLKQTRESTEQGMSKLILHRVLEVNHTDGIDCKYLSFMAGFFLGVRHSRKVETHLECKLEACG